jgi:hypothetical protein
LEILSSPINKRSERNYEHGTDRSLSKTLLGMLIVFVQLLVGMCDTQKGVPFLDS